MKIISKISFYLCVMGGLLSCDSYLDKQPDEPLTLKTVFEKKATTEGYLYQVFSYLPKYWDAGAYDEEGWIPASDEGIFSYDRGYRRLNNGSVNPSDVPYDKWDRYYKGIREANIFLANIDRCLELTPKERLIYRSEARFLRATYYFLLMRQYGPIILIGDEILPHTGFTYNVPRNTWDECVSYVESELTQIASILPPQPTRDDQYGKPTSGAALAMKSRLLLYNASPLFNPQEGKEYLYKEVKNPDGTPIFPQRYDADKWRKAAEAAREVINSGVYELVSTGNTYNDLRNIFAERWNSEIIFARTVNINSSWVMGVTPRQMKGYGGHGTTQNMVDAFGMQSSGRYPITGYNAKGAPIIDPKAGYSEDGFENFTHPWDNRAPMTNKMYVGRDPRFYMDIVWAGMEMTYGGSTDKYVTIEFYYNSTSGPGKSHDYAPAGYLPRKFTRKDNDPINGNWGDNRVTWPYIRLAEIYLNYAEALNEYNPGHPDILTYVNKIRERAGMPKLENAYPELNLTSASAQTDMRELIKKERRVELAFEGGFRYFDTRRWLDAGQVEKNIYGMNVFAPNQKNGGGYWSRIVIEKRYFDEAYYLYPMSQKELDRNKDLQQNKGW